MAITLIDLLNGAKFRSDQLGTDRVTDTEWTTLANEAIVRAWTLAAAARQDFQVSSQDFVVASGQTASIAVPATLFGLLDVVANPDTANEFSLGPFAWQNRRAPGGWRPPIFTAQGAQRARMMGSLIYLEPAIVAGGTYRVWFSPKPTTLLPIDFAARCATAVGVDINAGNYSSAGFGATRTMTSTIPGDTLTIDGISPGVGDIFLGKDCSAPINNGLYQVSQASATAIPWIATRLASFSSNANIKIGQRIFVSEGTINGGNTWTLASVAGIDASPMTFAIAAAVTVLDPILEPWAELLKVLMAIASLKRDERAPRDWYEDRDTLIQQMQMAFRQIRANNGPQKMIDTDARGPAFWNGVGW